jgi:LacI family transcriptional regulator
MYLAQHIRSKTMKVAKPIYNPLYQQIRMDLEKKIESGRYPVGHFFPSERELAKMYKVNRLTVRRALKEMEKKGLINQRQGLGTIVAKQHTEVDLKCAVIYFHHINNVFHDSFYGEVFAGIEKTLSDLDGRLLITSTKTSSPEKVSMITQEENLSGIILLGVMDDEYILDVTKDDTPIVLVDYYNKKLNVDSVIIDDRGGGYQAVEYLHGLGHRKIAYIGGLRGSKATKLKKEASSRERQKGYFAALKALGITETYAEEESIGVEGGERAMEKLFEQSSEITGVFAFDNMMARGAINTIRKRGLRVPEDISVVSFWTDLKMFYETDPPLTTINVSSAERVGTAAVKRLVKRIKDKNAEPKKIVVPTKLIVRSSCMRVVK